MMRYQSLWFVLWLLLIGTTATASEEDVDLSIDAQLGFEALQEPVTEATEEAELGSLENNGYVTVNAAALLQFFNIQAFLQAPLRFRTQDFTLREEDWDDTEELLRAVRCARIDYMDYAGNDTRLDEAGSCMSWTPNESVGSVSSPRADFTYLSARLHPLYNYSLGYGSIINGYNAMLEEDHYRDGVTLEMNFNRSLVISAGLSDVADPTVTAGRIAWRPIQQSDQDQTTNTSGYYDAYGNWIPTYTSVSPIDTHFFAELGFTGAADFQAPVLVTDEVTGLDTYSSELLAAGGFDARIRFSRENIQTMDEYNVMRFELGTEYNEIVGFASASHNHLRFYYDVGAFDFFVDAEYRAIFGRYMPAYFDQHYRVQRTQYLLSDDQREAAGATSLSMTKRDFLASLPNETTHGFAATTEFRFWSSDPQNSQWTRAADLWLFVEQVPDRDQSGRAGVGLALYTIDDKLDVWAQYVQQGWSDFTSIFSLNGAVLEVDARYLLTEELYLNFFYDQTWFFREDTSDLFDTTNDFGMSLGFLNEL